MSFEIKNKVALISGGASGIGLSCAKELLRNEVKGVTIADINDDSGKKALEEIEKEFGPNKAIYVKTDVSNKESFEAAFKKTIEVFENIDILINSAGIFNDFEWEKEIDVNIKGVIHGVLLGLENYIPKHKTADEGVIVNISSIAGLQESFSIPFYSATKFAINGLSKAFGNEFHFKRTKIRVLALCPGFTETPINANTSGKFINSTYEELGNAMMSAIEKVKSMWQKPESVALGLVKIIKDAKTGTVWVAEGGKDPYEYIYPSIQSFRPT